MWFIDHILKTQISSTKTKFIHQHLYRKFYCSLSNPSKNASFFCPDCKFTQMDRFVSKGASWRWYSYFCPPYFICFCTVSSFIKFKDALNYFSIFWSQLKVFVEYSSLIFKDFNPFYSISFKLSGFYRIVHFIFLIFSHFNVLFLVLFLSLTKSWTPESEDVSDYLMSANNL